MARRFEVETRSGPTGAESGRLSLAVALTLVGPGPKQAQGDESTNLLKLLSSATTEKAAEKGECP